MSPEEINKNIGRLVMTTDPGVKLGKSIGPHGPYELIRMTKAGKVLLKGYEFSVNTSSLSLFLVCGKSPEPVAKELERELNHTKEAINLNDVMQDFACAVEENQLLTFLTEPQKQLGNRSPIWLMRQGRFDEVASYISKLYSEKQ
jgi:hypothetical protein